MVNIGVVDALVNQGAAAGEEPRGLAVLKDGAGLIDRPQNLYIPPPLTAPPALLLLGRRHVRPPRNVHQRVLLAAGLPAPAFRKVLQHIPRRGARRHVASLVVPRFPGALGGAHRHAGLVKVWRLVGGGEGAEQRMGGGVKAAIRQVQAPDKGDEAALFPPIVGLGIANDGLSARGGGGGRGGWMDHRGDSKNG